MVSIYDELNLSNHPNVYKNSSPARLIEKTIKRGEGVLSDSGALVVKTGKHTGRSANDKYVVRTATTEEKIWWDNGLHAMTTENFNKLKKDIMNYIKSGEEIYISERSVGALKEHNIGVRFISNHPSHTLFTQHLFRPLMKEIDQTKDFTILHAPLMKINPADYGAHADVIITTCFDTNTTLIVGSLYAGEIKKSMFCVMNYLLPDSQILPMHAGASRLENGEVSAFFGLSGTGKTTLSTDEGTYLIGDDEHGMSDNGIFNFENGCYAKTYKLSPDTEPDIFRACNQFGALLENVVINEDSRLVDFFDKSIAENGRASYSLDFIDELEKSSTGKIPSHLFFLSADAFGILPPVAQLTKEQAMFYFVLGYTAKLAGTEIGVVEPQAAFSTCFGAPFMLRHPEVYASLLGQYLDKYDIKVWMINTGWTGGPYGVGQRFPIHVTRKIIRTIQAGELNQAPTEIDPIFGFHIPTAVADISTSVLRPERSWPDKGDYQKKANELALSFHQQMKKFGSFYEKNISGAPLYQG